MWAIACAIDLQLDDRQRMREHGVTYACATQIVVSWSGVMP